MTITYAIWQGSSLLSVNNIATSAKEMDSVIDSLNASHTARVSKYHANVQKVEVKA